MRSCQWPLHCLSIRTWSCSNQKTMQPVWKHCLYCKYQSNGMIIIVLLITHNSLCLIMITIYYWLSMCDEFTLLVSLLLTCMIYDSSIPLILPKFIHPYVTGTPVFYIKKIEGRQSACQQNVTIIEPGWCYCPLTKFWLFYKQGWDKTHQSQGRLLTLPRTRAPCIWKEQLTPPHPSILALLVQSMAFVGLASFLAGLLRCCVLSILWKWI